MVQISSKSDVDAKSFTLPGDEARRFQAVVEQIPVFIATANVDGYVAYLNKTARQWAGLNGDEQPSGWRLAGDVLAILSEAAEKGSWSGERQRFLDELPGAARNRTVMQTVTAHKDADGALQFYSTIAMDISE